jgi:hypothetical protein
VTLLPLSAVRTHCLDRPSIFTWSAGQRACAEKALPVRFWHARQWQTDTRTGSPVTLTLSCPQRQEAVRFVIP